MKRGEEAKAGLRVAYRHVMIENTTSVTHQSNTHVLDLNTSPFFPSLPTSPLSCAQAIQGKMTVASAMVYRIARREILRYLPIADLASFIRVERDCVKEVIAELDHTMCYVRVLCLMPDTTVGTFYLYRTRAGADQSSASLERLHRRGSGH